MSMAEKQQNLHGRAPAADTHIQPEMKLHFQEYRKITGKSIARKEQCFFRTGKEKVCIANIVEKR